jgi:hypothetical protein
LPRWFWSRSRSSRPAITTGGSGWLWPRWVWLDGQVPRGCPTVAMAHILHRRIRVGADRAVPHPDTVGVQGRGAASPDSGVHLALKDLRVSPRLIGRLRALRLVDSSARRKAARHPLTPQRARGPLSANRGAAFCRAHFQALEWRPPCSGPSGFSSALGSQSLQHPALKSDQRNTRRQRHKLESLAHCARDAATRWCAARIKCAPAAHARATRGATSAGDF